MPDAHIDAMVAVAVVGPGRISPERRAAWRQAFGYYVPKSCRNGNEARQASELGALLRRENQHSINHSDGENREAPKGYRFHPDAVYMSKLPDLVEAFKLISCYEYQVSEHPGWEGSEAKEFCAELRKRLTDLLPGYDTAPWSWKQPVLVPARLDILCR